MVSIPFEQGDVFRRFSSIYHFSSWHVSNPFRAGRCLSTQKLFKTMPCIRVSIPFEQGDVFRRDVENVPVAGTEKSQSLSSRAMSFDCTYGTNTQARTASLNPFRSGRCLSTSQNTTAQHRHSGLNPFRSGRCLSTLKLLMNS